MKVIFDFDGVLFNTKEFLRHLYACLEREGVSNTSTNEYYNKVGGTQFSLKKLLSHFSVRANLYEEILGESKNFINKELLKIVRKLGRENCYMITHANKEWQLDKIKSTGIGSFFSEIIIVSESKKEAVEKICALNINEEVVFIDDKTKYFEGLDFKKYPNLKTILYDEKGLKKLNAIIP
ncbi:MAG TPA: HAD family hydrolase [Candidatus Paceibacterota bacterium]|nr:HAD family hydrolase [Candidatus Paceibacterota bacterium]